MIDIEKRIAELKPRDLAEEELFRELLQKGIDPESCETEGMFSDILDLTREAVSRPLTEEEKTRKREQDMLNDPLYHVLYGNLFNDDD